ncbi:Mannose-6-phosphate isomerase [Blastocladiella emersonii ATCC 22665]|nr:Mannose-6-phosphate isomerase [Blastocladiella emersonii ATCC 22665]
MTSSSSTAPPAAIELVPRVMNYAWGKHGTASAVARLAEHHLDAPIDQKLPYAELWMGTHVNAPAVTRDADRAKLGDLIAADPVRYLGPRLAAHTADLPFLLKVLSVGKALSIQAHPDKRLAERLHAQFPDVYRDANHKPEMAVALTDFEALYGFRSTREVADHLVDYPELAAVAGREVADAFIAMAAAPVLEDARPYLRALFSAVMTCDSAVVAEMLATMLARIRKPPGGPADPVGRLIARVHAQFPGDVGVFCVLLMNHVTLAPGEALFLGANELHAYLAGDCIEVMATSDNVVRAGLTPKFKDVQTLTEMLTYTQLTPAASRLAAVPHPDPTFAAATTVFDPPIPEFAIHCTRAADSDSDAEGVPLPPVDGPSILIVTQGEGVLETPDAAIDLVPGTVVFAVPNTHAAVRVRHGFGADVVVYQAFCDQELPPPRSP